MKRTIEGGKRRPVAKPALTATVVADRRSRARATAEGQLPEMWYGSFAAETVERLHRFELLAQQCAKNPAREPVHELRVEARRLLTRLDVLSSALPPEVLAKGRRAVKKQLKASRSLRDAQVQGRLVRRLLPGQPELDAFARFLKRHEVRVARAAREKIARPKQIRRLERLQRVMERSLPFEAATEREGQAVARLVLQRARARLRRAESAGDGDAASLHRLRIAVKACRYLAEELPAMRPGISAAERKKLGALQARLGRVHDRALLQARWEKFARRHEPALLGPKSREILLRPGSSRQGKGKG